MFTYLKNFVGVAQKVKKFEFCKARLGGNPNIGTPNFY